MPPWTYPELQDCQKLWNSCLGLVFVQSPRCHHSVTSCLFYRLWTWSWSQNQGSPAAQLCDPIKAGYECSTSTLAASTCQHAIGWEIYPKTQKWNAGCQQGSPSHLSWAHSTHYSFIGLDAFSAQWILTKHHSLLHALNRTHLRRGGGVRPPRRALLWDFQLPAGTGDFETPSCRHAEPSVAVMPTLAPRPLPT